MTIKKLEEFRCRIQTWSEMIYLKIFNFLKCFCCNISYMMIGYCIRVIFFKAWLSIFKFGSTFIIKREQLLMFFFFFFLSLLSIAENVRRFSFVKRRREATRDAWIWVTDLTIFDKFSNEIKEVALISKFNFWQSI